MLSKAKQATGGTKVWVEWESAQGPQNTSGELLDLNDRGFVALSLSGPETLWIPHRRIFSVSTSLQVSTTTVAETTAAQAEAVIQAVSDATLEPPLP